MRTSLVILALALGTAQSALSPFSAQKKALDKEFDELAHDKSLHNEELRAKQIQFGKEHDLEEEAREAMENSDFEHAFVMKHRSHIIKQLARINKKLIEMEEEMQPNVHKNAVMRKYKEKYPMAMRVFKKISHKLSKEAREKLAKRRHLSQFNNENK